MTPERHKLIRKLINYISKQRYDLIVSMFLTLLDEMDAIESENQDLTQQMSKGLYKAPPL